MGLDNPIHIAFLLILLLLVFGAKRLPEMGKSLGSGMRGFKDALSGEATEQASLVAQHQQPTRPGRETRPGAQPAGRAGEGLSVAVADASIGHEDRLSRRSTTFEELRGRLIVSLAAVAVAFGGVHVAEPHAAERDQQAARARRRRNRSRRAAGRSARHTRFSRAHASWPRSCRPWWVRCERPGSGASAATRTSLAPVAPQLRRAIASLSAAPQGNKPVTLGIGEPFTTTIGIALIFALILALPVVLYRAVRLPAARVQPRAAQRRPLR